MAWFELNNEEKIYFTTAGEGEETLIFINGLAMNTRGWGLQKTFFKKNYNVVLYDQRCQGLSSQIHKPFHYSELVKDLEKLTDFLKIEKAHIIGISYGTVIAKDFAINNPGKCGKVVLIVPPGKPDFKMKLFLNLSNSLIDKNLMEDFYAFLTYASFNRPLTDLIESQYELFSSAFLKNIDAPTIKSLLNSIDYEKDLNNFNEIKNETLIIAAAEDALNDPRAGKRFSEEMKSAQFLELHGSHAINFDKPDEVNSAILNFLEN